MVRSKIAYIGILVFIVMTIKGFSQEKNEYKHFEYSSIGAKFGMIYSAIDLQPAISETSPEPSFSGGIVYIFSQKKYVGLQVEVLYSQYRWKDTFNDGTVTNSFNYLELPLMTNIILGKGRFKYILNVGTYYAMLLGKDMKVNIPESNVYYPSVMERKERTSNYGLLLGGALRYISEVGIFQLDARFNYGFQKIYNTEATSFQYSNIMGANVSLIYSLNLKKND